MRISMEVLVAVGMVVVALAASVVSVILRRKRKRDELNTVRRVYGSDQNGYTPSIQQWQETANASLEASHKRRGIKGDAA